MSDSALRKWREERGLNISECATGASIDRKQWRALENGEGAHFDTVDAVVRFCRRWEVAHREEDPGSRIRYEDFSQREDAFA